MRARHTEVEPKFVEINERITAYAPKTSGECAALVAYPVGVALVRVKRFFPRVSAEGEKVSLEIQTVFLDRPTISPTKADHLRREVDRLTSGGGALVRADPLSN